MYYNSLFALAAVKWHHGVSKSHAPRITEGSEGRFGAFSSYRCEIRERFKHLTIIEVQLIIQIYKLLI